MATKPRAKPDELDRLLQAREWRLKKFREIGYNDADAWELAKGMANFHQVEAHIAKGATLDQARRIAL